MTATELGFNLTDAQRLMERAVIGAVISSTTAAQKLGGIVRADDFAVPQHPVIFGAAMALVDRGQPVDPVTVLDELARTGDLSIVGGGGYLHDCMAAAPADAGYHARRVAEDAAVRFADVRLIQARQALSETGRDPLARLDLARDFAEEAFSRDTGAALRTAGELFTAVINDIEQGRDRGLPTPWIELNRVVAGLAPGEMAIVGGRPGTGKSIIGAQLAAHTAIGQRLPSLMVSLEMSAEEIMYRLISAASRVPLEVLLRRQLSAGDWDRVARAHEQFAGAALVIDDQSTGLAQIRARLLGMKRTGAARLVVVDYLQLMEGPGESRQQAVAAVSRGLKRMAREFDVPVVVLAQVNRNPEHRTDHRPVAADLRDSGQIEADADLIILLHREDLHDPASTERGVIELIIDKQRQGARTTVSLGFQGEYGRCVDLALEAS